MPLGRHLTKTLLLAGLVIAALFAFGCAKPAEPAAEATPTPEPVIVSMEVLDLNDKDFGDMPAPTATPAPTPTPIMRKSFMSSVSIPR